MVSLYQEQIIDRAQHPQFGGELTTATHRGDGANQSCGDEIHWEIELKGETLAALRHSGRSCAICAASADLLAEKLTGSTRETVKHTTTEEVQELIGIPLSPVRLKCALLPLETLKLLLPD